MLHFRYIGIGLLFDGIVNRPCSRPVVLAPLLGSIALKFGPTDYCALMLFGFVCVSFVATGSLLNGLAMLLRFENSRGLERVPGIEPGYSAWKAAALPLSYTRGGLDPKQRNGGGSWI